MKLNPFISASGISGYAQLLAAYPPVTGENRIFKIEAFFQEAFEG